MMASSTKCSPAAVRSSGRFFLARQPLRVQRTTGPIRAASKAPEKVTVTFKLRKYICEKDEVIALVGSHNALGDWDVNKAMLLNQQDGHAWSRDVTMDLQGDDGSTNKVVGYKYVVLKKESDGMVAVKWQEGKSEKLDFSTYWAMANDSPALSIRPWDHLYLQITDSWDRLKNAMEDAKVATYRMALAAAAPFLATSPAGALALQVYKLIEA